MTIYLDYNASTPVDPAVRDAMTPYLGERYGNPSSAHAYGRPLRAAVDAAREQVAALLGATREEITFTSGGTESNNHVIKGVAHTLRDKGRHLVVSSVEHPSVLNPCKSLAAWGFETTIVEVDTAGRVDPAAIAAAIRPDTILVSVMHANNEVGTIEPIREIAAVTRRAGVWLHTDAAQSCGKIPTRVDELDVDFLTVAGHKLYAPQGIGAIYIRKGIAIEPLMHGAGHEGGRRSGTEAVASIVGLGKAAELAAAKLGDPRAAALRDRMWQGLTTALGDRVALNGDPERRLPNTLNVGFRGLIGRELLAALPELCASPGAACHGTIHKPSHVLAAMRVPEAIALGSIRFSVGRATSEADVDSAVGQIVAAVRAKTGA
jgi:cysteine desulfurase